MEPLINVLVRTSNRPELFKRAIRSVLRQSYRNVRIIVSYDTLKRPVYLKSDLTAIHVNYPKDEPAFYNRYCNDLKEQVNEGFMFYLDDDDFIQDATALARIVPFLDEDKATLIQMSRFRRKVMPMRDEIIHGKIGMPCLILHSKHKNLASFNGDMNADYQFIKEVCGKIPHNFVPIVLAECGKRSFGRMR